MNQDRMLAQFESFKHQFEDNLIDSDGKPISFDQAIESERTSKESLVKSVRELIEVQSTPNALGAAFYKCVQKHLNSINWRDVPKFESLEKQNKSRFDSTCSIIGNALLSKETESDIFQSSFDKIRQYHLERTKEEPSRASFYHLLFVALACKQDSKTIFGTVTFFSEVSEFFLGEKLLQFTDKDIKQSFEIFNNLIAQLSEVMRNQWNWNIKNNLDVQSALWLEFRNKNEKYATYLKRYRARKSNLDTIKRSYEREVKQMSKETEKQAVVTQRCGQNSLRNELIKMTNGRCELTKIKTLELLRVSHIKPWSECESDDERLDINNCLLLSGLWDLAFDRGLITFDEGGKLLISDKLAKDELALDHLVERKRIFLNKEQAQYMEWHRNKVFQS